MKGSERGVALLSVLLLVAVASIVAVAMIDSVAFGLRRATNMTDMGQARWYALGAEQLARAQAYRLYVRNSSRTTLEGDWQNRPYPFPIEGGMILARVRDGGNCFNVNAVVEGQAPAYRGEQLGTLQFVALAEAVGIPRERAVRMASALTDWIDTDAAGSAEDGAYVEQAQPYRTGNTLIAEVSELRAIEGFEPGYYNLLRPHLCALPYVEHAINVNTLTPEQAVLVTMLTRGAVTVEAARSVIAGRPAEGWSNATSFWSAFEGLSAAGQPAVSLRTQYFALAADVRYGGAESAMSALFSSEQGQLELVARRWTREE